MLDFKLLIEIVNISAHKVYIFLGLLDDQFVYQQITPKIVDEFSWNFCKR